MTQGIVDHDTVHHLFPGLNKLLDFQRKFSIELEQQYELPWEQQRWGRCFSTNVRPLFDPGGWPFLPPIDPPHSNPILSIQSAPSD